MLQALGSSSCDFTHSCDITQETAGTIVTGIGFCVLYETEGTICYEHWVLRLVISHIRQGVRCNTGLAFCLLWHHTPETGATICYGHWVLRLVMSHTRQGVRFVTGIGFCLCDITYLTGGTI